MSEITISLDGQEIARHTVPVIDRAEPFKTESLKTRHYTKVCQPATGLQREYLGEQAEVVIAQLSESLEAEQARGRQLVERCARLEDERVRLEGEITSRDRQLDCERFRLQELRTRSYQSLFDEVKHGHAAIKELWPALDGSLLSKVCTLVSYYQSSDRKYKETLAQVKLAEEARDAVAAENERLKAKLNDIDSTIHRVV